MKNPRSLRRRKRGIRKARMRRAPTGSRDHPVKMSVAMRLQQTRLLRSRRAIKFVLIICCSPVILLIPIQPIPRRSRSAYSCREDGCCNLIIPGTRWRSCETCRALSRTLRQEKKAAENSQLNEGAFVNMTVDSSAGPTIPHANTEPGSSTAITPMDVSSRPGVPATETPPTYPTGYTSTSTLQTLNEPPPDQSSQSEV